MSELHPPEATWPGLWAGLGSTGESRPTSPWSLTDGSAVTPGIRPETADADQERSLEMFHATETKSTPEESR